MLTATAKKLCFQQPKIGLKMTFCTPLSTRCKMFKIALLVEAMIIGILGNIGIIGCAGS